MFDIESSYYDDTSRLSNSSLGWFITEGPLKFYQRLNKEISEDTSSMKMGRMIHMYLLQNEEFFDNYAISDAEPPKSAQQKEFCTIYMDSKSTDPILKAIEAFSSVYSIKGMSENKIAEKATEMLETLKDYIDFLDLIKEKCVMKWSEFNRLKIIRENIKLHRKANELLYDLDEDEWEQHNEFRINWTFPDMYEGFYVDCKSLLDRIVIKKDYSEVVLIDIKTTGNIYNFKESIDKYDYYRQMCFYHKAIDYYLKNVRNLTDEQIKNIKRTTYMILVGSDNQIRVLTLNPKLIEERFETITNTIFLISWHMSNSLWDYSKDYYTGDGSEIIE